MPDAQAQLDELYAQLWQEQGIPNNDPVCVVLP
jgi:hypothetical protein